MIQRIQSVYLLVVTALLIVTMCLPLGTFVTPSGLFDFNASGVVVNDTVQSTWGLLGILILSAMISFATILLFKNRVLQIRMTVFNSLLILGFYIAFVAFYFALKTDASTLKVSWSLCLPLVGMILNYLAIRAIGRDEVMVKAADRLR